MLEDMSIYEDLNEFSKIICQLTSIMSKLEETLILLSSLSSSYEHLVITLLYKKSFIDLDGVTIVLLSNKMTKNGFIGEVEAEGLVARVKTKEKGFGRSHQDLECYYCHNKGHIKANCRKLKERKERKSTPRMQLALWRKI